MKINQLASLICIVIVFSCNPSNKQSKKYVLKFKGSESMHGTFDMLKSEFEQIQDSITIVIEGGGSRTGLLAIKDGSADIGLSSYQFDLDSVLGENHRVTEHIVAYDGIVIITNKNNPLRQLTNEQVAGVFSGTFSDWAQLGGIPGQIVPVIRDHNSGTQRFFQDYFNIDKLNPLAVISEENRAIVSRVNENENGIGFIGFGYFTESINSMEIPSGQNHDSAYISPTFKNLGAGTYPLKRSLQMYYRETNNPALKAFLDYLDSQKAQLVILEQGLLPKSIGNVVALNQ